MIISVDELKKFITTDQTDEVLEAELQALEALVRKYTNNNFQLKDIRFRCECILQKLQLSTIYLAVGDTVEISQSKYNNGIYTIKSIESGLIELDKPLYDEPTMLVTKVVYPKDVQMGVVNMVKWDLNNREKVGVQSETISRHSVSYFNMDGDNSLVGYPKSLVGFLKPYLKARF